MRSIDFELNDVPACTSLPYARAAVVETTFHRPSPSAWLTKRAFVVESETMIVPFAPPSEDHVTNDAPCGLRPEAVVMLRMPCVPAFSGVVVILKLTALLLLLELLMD
jgi:hypothetical protein